MGEKYKISLSVNVDSALLSNVQAIANREGVKLQCLVGEALSEFLDSRRYGKLRAHVMAAYQGSHRQYEWLYQMLTE